VRTFIAVMGFGFLLEKFDLFLELAAPSLADRTLSLPGQTAKNIDRSSRKTDIRLGKNMEDTQKHYPGGEIKKARQSLRWA
jgi:hypothetical protein